VGYLGSTYSTFDPTRTIAAPRDADRFSGNGSATSFTLTRSVDSPTDVEVFVGNVRQEPLVAYNIAGTALTFTGAPVAGTNNIYVVYRAFNSNITVTLPDGVVSAAKLANNIRLFTVDNYTANGSATSFALSETPASANTLMVAVNGILQTSPNNYTVSGSTITFTSAPAVNANVSIRHLGYRSTSTITALAANTTITQPVLSNPTITLAGASSFKANVDFYDSTGTTLVGNVSTYTANSLVLQANTNLDLRTNNTTQMRIDSSGNLLFNSGYGSAATAYGCRAWVNFNGTGTVAIRGSGNVTSITDNGVGDYTVNFTTAMPDANYSLACTLQSIAGANKGFILQNELANPAAGSCRLMVLANGATTAAADDSYVFASFFR
jgi:hypothetical protein